MDVFMGTSTTGVGTTLTGSGLIQSERPMSYEQLIHKQYLNGQAPMLALLNGSPKEDVDDPKFHWYTKQILPVSRELTQDGSTQGSGVYTDAAMTTLYTSGASAGTTLYVKVLATAAQMGEFRPQLEVLLRNESDVTRDAVAIVRDVNVANRRLEVNLVQADPNASGTTGWNRIRVIGDVNPENYTIPEAISLMPTEYYNYIQEFCEPVRISDTALATRLRTVDDLRLERKADALDIHTMKIEQAMLFGYLSERVSPVNGEPERTMMGLVPFLKANGGVTSNYQISTDYAGLTWLEGGWDWLEQQLTLVFQYGGSSRLAFCGTATLRALKQLEAYHGTINLEPGQTRFGMAVNRWVTDFGEILFKTHPLFSHDPADSRSMLIFDPKNVRYVRLQGRDTKYVTDNSPNEGGNNVVDGIVEAWKTKCSLKYYFPNEGAYLTGFGLNNTLGA